MPAPVPLPVGRHALFQESLPRGLFCYFSRMKRKKVVLYNPKAVFFDLPLALVGIGSALDPERFEVRIVDGRLEDDARETLRRELEGALCFGVTTLTGAPLRDAIAMTRFAKALHPELPVIWGGWHTSLFPLDTLRDEKTVDITVQAQGEVTFVEIVEHLAAGKSLENVAGLCYRKEGIPVQNAPRAMTNMEELPRYNYELIDVERYFKAKGRRQFDYFSSSGCYFRCAFCADPFVFNRKWSAISPERMGEELAHWKEKYNFTDVNFQDETFFTYRKRVVAIAQEFIDRKLNISWAATMRADQGERLSDEDFALLKRSGLRRVLIGVESGSQEMMDWMKKDIKLEQVYTCAERCRAHNIAVVFPFIVGFPGETEKNFRASLRMAAELKSMKHDFTTPIFYFKPYPGSAITQEVVRQGYELPATIEEWSEFDYIGSSGPWLSDDRYELVERFKFYNQLAYRKNGPLLWPLQTVARWRMRKWKFGFPLEKALADRLGMRPKLS
jgi:anaerobic magnesium-protoporphyrin IX monomethyl ester cyclase